MVADWMNARRSGWIALGLYVFLVVWFLALVTGITGILWTIWSWV